jgi:hypothetical protein
MGLLSFDGAGVAVFAAEHRGHFEDVFPGPERLDGFRGSQCFESMSEFDELDPQSRKSERDRQQQETPPNTWLNATAISKRIGRGDDAIKKAFRSQNSAFGLGFGRQPPIIH